MMGGEVRPGTAGLEEPAESHMTQGGEETPGYLTGEMEAPQGVKHDEQGFDIRVYTPEQQARLHVTDEGEPVDGSVPTEDHGASMPDLKSEEEDKPPPAASSEGSAEPGNNETSTAPAVENAKPGGEPEYRPPPTNPKFRGKLCPWSHLVGDFAASNQTQEDSPWNRMQYH